MFKRKYDFAELEVGETKTFLGRLANIRSAASMWGTRYGVWLKVKKAPSGAEVTRVATSFSPQRTVRVTLDQRLQRIEDGIRFLSLLTIQLKKQIDETITGPHL